MEYYRQDIEAFKVLGYEVIICTRYRDIPLKFDILFVWWWTYAFIPVIFTRLLGRPALVTGVFNFRLENKSLGLDYFSRPIHQRFLIWLGVKLASANLFVSEAEFKEVPAYFKLSKSHYFPCAIADDYFNIAKLDAPRSGLLNIAWSGSENLKRKGVWDIVEAIRILRDSGTVVNAVLAGKQGDGFMALKQQVEKTGLENQIKMLGEVTHEEKLNLFAKSRIYLQPSHYEGFGLATAEAMAAGCNIITCDVGEVRNVIGENGIYVKPGNPKQLAQAIKDLLANKELSEDLELQSTKRLKSLYSFARKVSDLRAVMADIN
ncbi:glycosyltransferase family 4 protein [Variovorax sp. Varisp41]|uniref:glycosyltransferase family 4 protein n=1 Tax=unclassified Variovorax TaxID=663243 RepID=UPI0039B39804